MSIAARRSARADETLAACRREFVAVARSFWLIPELLPRRVLDDVSLLYCFCRRLDDAVDEAATPAAARGALASWRNEISGSAPRRPLIAAFLASAAEAGLRPECVQFLLDGMESDLGPVRMADDAELLRYAYRVSAAVGLMLAPLLGIRGAEAERRVVDLGLALQLSNVLLGVEGDARRDRVYLPSTRLAAAGLSAGDVLANPRHPRIAAVLRGIADLAEPYYRSAARGAAVVPLRYRHGVLLLGRVYGGLGRRAAQLGVAPSAPAGLPLLSMVLHLTQLLVLGLDPRVLGVVAPPAHDAALHRAIAGWPGTHS